MNTMGFRQLGIQPDAVPHKRNKLHGRRAERPVVCPRISMA